MSKVGILGAGSWGTALAHLLYTNGHQVTVWSIDEREIEMLNTEHEHRDKLPGVSLPEEMNFTTDLPSAVKEKELVILAVPSPYIRDTARKASAFVAPGQILVNVAKGIEASSLMTMTQVIEQEIPAADVAVLSGPSHAEEVGRELPTTVVVGARTEQTADFVRDHFMNDVFRVYTNPDVLGIEIGAALKNVIALAAGIADGLGCGDNAKAALITRGVTEMTRLGVAIGGRSETFFGLTGIGDLIVTCESRHSRNRHAGMLIGQGKTPAEAMDEVKMVVEGVHSAKAAKALSEKYQVPMPIVEQVNEVLFENKKAKDALRELMHRDRKTEHSEIAWK